MFYNQVFCCDWVRERKYCELTSSKTYFIIDRRTVTNQVSVAISPSGLAILDSRCWRSTGNTSVSCQVGPIISLTHAIVKWCRVLNTMADTTVRRCRRYFYKWRTRFSVKLSWCHFSSMYWKIPGPAHFRSLLPVVSPNSDVAWNPCYFQYFI